MSSEWQISELGKEAFNASRPFSFKDHPEVVFINTGDVLYGRFLHEKVSEGKGLPGQAKKALKKDDILLTEIRPGNGRYAYVDFDAEHHVVSTKFMVIESLGRVTPRFLYHVLTNQAALDEFQRIAESRSGTFPQITFDSISHFPIPTPPLIEQEELVEFLDALDGRIALLRETNATLETIAQTLFKSWFVDFDPVRAKVEGRTPERMDEATAELFPDSFEESELGLVPKGWRVVTLGDVLKISYGKNLPTNKLLPDGYPVYGGNGQIGFFDRYIYETRQVLVACRGAASGKVNQSAPKSFVTNNSLVLESDHTTELPFGYLKAYMLNSDLSPFVTGSAQPQVTIDNLKVFRLIVPSAELLKTFESTSSMLEDKIATNFDQIQTLSSLRDTLLPRLISGQLRLSGA